MGFIILNSGQEKYIFTQAAAPTGEGEKEGSLWYDTSVGKLYSYNGAAWNALGASNYATADLANPEHQWDLNNSLADGIGSDDLDVGTANYSATAKLGAASQDVNNNTANYVGHSTLLDAIRTDYTDGITLCGFVRFKAVGANEFILSKKNDANNDLRIYLNSGSNKIDFIMNNGGVGVTLTPNQVCGANTWYFWALVITADGDMYAYVNDVTANDTATFANIMADGTSNNLTYGLYAPDGNEQLNGFLDALQIWDTALSATQIKALSDRTVEDTELQDVTGIRVEI